jgi:hypothetical protein
MSRSLGLSILLGFALAAGSVPSRAQTVRLPKAGDPAFSVDVPTGWTYSYDTNGNLQFVASDHSAGLQLSMITDQGVAATTLEAVAANVFQTAGATPYTREEPGTVVGHTGEAFYGTLTEPQVVLQMKLIMAKLDDTHIAAISSLIRPDATPQQIAALKALIGLVQLSVPK